MGLGFAFLDYLAEKRLIDRGSSILDIGSQNLYNATPENVTSFVKAFGQVRDPGVLQKEAERLAYFSTPRPDERTTFVAELFELTEIGYLGYDVCPAPSTEIFDLNIQRIPAALRNSFDLVLNFGTTEHIINQLNSFEVMHDAMKVGGVCFHQLPSIGYIDHGYFNYNPLFLDELVTANDYEVVDRFYTDAGSGPFGPADVRDPDRPSAPHSASGPDRLPNFNLNYIVRKTTDAPFYVGLEIATTHATLSEEVAAKYGNSRRVAAGDVIRGQTHGLEERLRAANKRILDLENSRSWRITRPLRSAAKALMSR